MTLNQTLAWLTDTLPPPEARVEAERMLMHLLAVNRAFLRVWPDKFITQPQQATLQQWLTRRQAGEPLAYILGETGFYDVTLTVNPAVLIPRADTELLVDLALTHLPEHQPSQVADLGTGSGAIAIAIARQRPQAQVTAVDASQDALQVAQDNVCRYRLDIHCLHSHWFSALQGQRFHLIVSNPPYIAEGDPHLQQTSLPFEPLSALTSGSDGLDDLRAIIAQAPAHLLPDGWLLLEHGHDQGASVRALMQQHGFSHLVTHQDLGGNDRVTEGQYHAQ